jgi:hypothetical protein
MLTTGAINAIAPRAFNSTRKPGERSRGRVTSTRLPVSEL